MRPRQKLATVMGLGFGACLLALSVTAWAERAGPPADRNATPPSLQRGGERIVLGGSPLGPGHSSGYELPTYVGSPDGTVITGQDGFYIPVPDSQDGLVYTYVDNALGLPQNPTGQDQFVGVTGGDPGLPVPFARAQRDMPYGDGTGLWASSFDIAATYLGELPSAQNIGSFSTQVFPDQATFIALARWTDPDTAANWNADYVWFDAGGTQLIEEVPNPGFQNLLTEHWYRWTTTFDLDTSEILEVSITDLTTNTTVTQAIADRYLFGGAGGAPTPTGFRYFGGAATAAGNTLAFDNLDINPAGGPDESNPLCIATGPDDTQDGFLGFVLDEYGSFASAGFGGGNAECNFGDNFRPTGEGVLEAAFTNGFVLYRTEAPDFQRELLSTSPDWKALLEDGSMDSLIPGGGANAGADTNDDGVMDRLTSQFEVTAPGVNLMFDVVQQVDTVNGLGPAAVSKLTQTYVITNDSAEAVNFVLLRQCDFDLVWDPAGDFGNDSVGTGTNDLPDCDRFVSQVEDGQPETAVTVSSPQGDVYYGGKNGVVPDCPVPGVPYGFGTDLQQWDAFGVPLGWDNSIAGVGCDTDGESGPAPAGCTAPCDGAIGLRIPVSLGPGGKTTVTIQHTYGSSLPDGCQLGCQSDAECDDGNGCTDDICQPDGECDNPPITCGDDGVDCTIDGCDPDIGCTYDPDDSACDDGVDCTDDTCDPAKDCQNVPDDSACDDANDCTDDTCDVEADCQFTNDDSNGCSDGDICTDDACVSGECVSTDVDCDDDDNCTIDSCVGGDCVHEDVECGEDEHCDEDTGDCVPDSILVSVDVKPRFCPNGIKRGANAAVWVALVGDGSIDLEQVDMSTIQLSRADGTGSAIGPQGNPRIKDLATPFSGELCDCHSAGKDGVLDIRAKFKTAAMEDAFGLGAEPTGTLVELTLTGTLLDGTAWNGEDCIRIDR